MCDTPRRAVLGLATSDRPTLNKAERAIADRLSDEIDRFNIETSPDGTHIACRCRGEGGAVPFRICTSRLNGSDFRRFP